MAINPLSFEGLTKGVSFAFDFLTGSDEKPKGRQQDISGALEALVPQLKRSNVTGFASSLLRQSGAMQSAKAAKKMSEKHVDPLEAFKTTLQSVNYRNPAGMQEYKQYITGRKKSITNPISDPLGKEDAASRQELATKTNFATEYWDVG